MYQLIGTRASRAFRVLWLLEELGAEYEHVPASPRSAEARAVNPSGKVPALRDGDTVIPDSTAIMTYLADRHAALTFPAGTPDRARQDALTHQILDDVDAVLWTAARHSFVLPEEHRVPEVKTSLKWEYTNNIRRLSEQLQDPFLMGDTMTIPDIILTHCLGWASRAGFPEPDAHLSDYAARLSSREAFQRAAALP
ncbi:glutathione S-transferase family protein [Roseovarius aestuariivivens]|uniref:glutathione S-transferase family protein n=1 Tax=Roseovarius aestuariivivens TaxID=1888910 RepID=UPI001080F03B|nr:glutathione S-transferase family protein [Roseovarius aestuariivivens]